MGKTRTVSTDQTIRLMRALAEELRLPLLQIARKSELARLNADVNQIKEISVTADAALMLVDSYLFSTQVLLGQQQLDLEPVSISAMMYDTAQYLKNMARLYDCDIDIDIRGKSGLIMAHPRGLQAAFTSLAYSFINANTDGSKQRIVLQAHKTRGGISAGVLTTNKDIPKDSLSIARKLFGSARSPMGNFTHNSGAGIYVADSLFSLMSTQLKVTKQKSSVGLTAILLPSHQLALL